MITYNFNTKEVGTIFDAVKSVVLNSHATMRFNIDSAIAEHCTVVPVLVNNGSYLAVAYPSSILDTIVLCELFDATSGKLMYKNNTFKFRIQDDILIIW